MIVSVSAIVMSINAVDRDKRLSVDELASGHTGRPGASHIPGYKTASAN